jgi:hypothetical protein
MIILIAFGFGLLSLLLGALLSNTKGGDSGQDFSLVGGVAWIIAAVMIVVLLISYPISLSTVSSMENFYLRNQKIYAEAVEKFPNAARVETTNGTAKTVLLSYEYTKEVMDYNKELQWYFNYQNHWFLKPFITKVSDKLKFIELSSEASRK